MFQGKQVLAVGDLGEIHFELANGKIELNEVRTNANWASSVGEQAEDGIEVVFRSNGHQVEAEIELEDEKIELEVEYGRGAVEGAQTLVVDGVASIDYDVQAESLTLTGIHVMPAWTHNVDEEEADEIEIVFRADDGTVVSVEIELD